MEYKDYLEQAKKYLSDDDGLASYREYYDKAVSSLAAGHEKAKSDINDEYLSDVSRAVTQSRMNSKNIDQYMASRGLSRSGEAEQERINENLSLNNTLSSLAKEKNRNLGNEDASHANMLLALEKELAEKEYDSLSKKDEKAGRIADKQLEMDNRLEDIELDRKKTESEHAYNEYMKRLEAELEELAEEKKREYETQKTADERKYNEKLTAEERAYNEKKTADERAYNEKKTAEERAYNEKKTAEEREYNEKLTAEEREYKNRLIEEEREYERAKLEEEREYAESQKALEENGKYTPKQSAESLAREIVKTYTKSGEKISSESDRMKIYDFLEEFKSNSNATDEYINELEGSLRSLGYKELSGKERNAMSVVNEAKSRYNEWYYAEVSRYDGTELTPLERSEKAREEVLFKQLDYCWLNTSTKAEFECCYDILGVSESVKRAYESRILITDPDTGKVSIRKPKGE